MIPYNDVWNGNEAHMYIHNTKAYEPPGHLQASRKRKNPTDATFIINTKAEPEFVPGMLQNDAIEDNLLASDIPADFSNRGGSRRDKGLRHFSLRVCQKLQQRGTATYAQVADDLLQDLVESTGQPIQEKNIRRRVYDALNVLLAIDIIIKSPSQKAIQWKGLPDTIVSVLLLVIDLIFLAPSKTIFRGKAYFNSKTFRTETKNSIRASCPKSCDCELNFEKCIHTKEF
jgi:hypothetical protein